MAVPSLGAAYLVFLGGQALWAALLGTKGHTAAAAPVLQVSPKVVALRQGLISNLGNPKMAVFFTSLLPQFTPRGASIRLPLLGLTFCLLTLSWLAALRLRRLKSAAHPRS